MHWDPEQYLRFADQRRRPFQELLARVGARHPRVVADLGCGPATLTRELAQRWPDADVEGVDDSPEMIERARAEGGDAVRLTLADLRDWSPKEPLDVLVSNATLQWVPRHVDLLDRFAGFLGPDGWLAVQVPGNFGEPSHTALRELAVTGPWRDRLSGVRWPDVEEPATYLARLAQLGLRVDAWETTYQQVLPGEDAVLEWMRGTRAVSLHALPSLHALSSVSGPGSASEARTARVKLRLDEPVASERALVGAERPGRQPGHDERQTGEQAEVPRHALPVGAVGARRQGLPGGHHGPVDGVDAGGVRDPGRRQCRGLLRNAARAASRGQASPIYSRRRVRPALKGWTCPASSGGRTVVA